MPVVFLIAIAAVLVGIYFAATGRGGELAYEHADYAPLDLGPVSAADIALLRPPTAMWGYNMQVTDEALDRIARAMRERDVTIAYLQEQLATLARDGSYTEPADAYTRQDLDSPPAPGIPVFPEVGVISEDAVTPESAQAPEFLEFSQAGEVTGLAEAPEALGSPHDPEVAGLAEAPYAPEPADIADTPYVPEPADIAEAPEVVGPAEAAQVPGPPQTPLVLKASAAKAPPAPEPDEATQPSETLQEPEAHDATQPSETLAPHQTQGPQGAFNTHDWWAEQDRAAREETARRQAAGPSGVTEDDSLAAAEEQGW